MKCVFVLVLCLTASSHLLSADAKKPFKCPLPEGVEITVPLSWYTDDWDPTEKLPFFLPDGTRVEEGSMVVDLDKAIKAAREEEDRLRGERSCLAEFLSGAHLEESTEGDDEDEESDEVAE